MRKNSPINAGAQKAGRGGLGFDHRELKYLGFHVARPEGGPERLGNSKEGWSRGRTFFGHGYMIEPASMTQKVFRRTVEALVKRTLRGDADLVLFEPKQGTFESADVHEQRTLGTEKLRLMKGAFNLTRGGVRGEKPTAIEQKWIEKMAVDLHIGDITRRGDTDEALDGRVNEVYKLIGEYLKARQANKPARR